MEDKRTNDKKFDQVRIIANPLSTNKVLNADKMIENILSKKQVFVKKSLNTFPPWLTPGSGKIPHLYDQIWNVVKCTSNPGFCNTPILSQVLMTSGLSTQMLGHIWNLANKKCIGVLTEEELYLILALIAICQNGSMVRDIEILKQLKDPLIPRIDIQVVRHLAIAKASHPQHYSRQENHPSAYGAHVPSQYNMPPAAQSYPMTGPPHSVTIHRPSPESLAGFNVLESPQNYSKYNSNSTAPSLATNSGTMVPKVDKLSSSNVNWDDDEFTEFQSIPTTVNSTSQLPSKPQLSNVSITSNPLEDYFMGTTLPDLKYDPSKDAQRSAASQPMNSSQSANQTKSGIPPAELESPVDDDDFTDFQSSNVSALDFDVEIKQPTNVLLNIKSMIDSNKPFSEHQESLLNFESNKQELSSSEPSKKESFVSSQSNTRDYSALKALDIEQTGPSLFDVGENNVMKLQPSNKLQSTFLSSNGQRDNLLEDEDDFSDFQSSTSVSNHTPVADRPTAQSVDNFKLKAQDILSAYNQPFTKPNMNVSTMNQQEEDDEFSDFKQAEPVKPIFTPNCNLDSVFDTGTNEISGSSNLATSAVTSSSALTCTSLPMSSQSSLLDDFSDLNLTDSKPMSSVHTSQPSLNTSFVDNFSSFNLNNKLDTVSHSTSDSHNNKSIHEIYNYDAPLFTPPPLPSTHITNSDDEDELCEDLFHDVDEVGHNTNHKSHGTSHSIGMSESTIDVAFPEQDKYGALRGVGFTGDDDLEGEEDDREKEREASDGDSTSLQLPSISSNEETVQTKTYDCCIYTLETSLNLFVTSQIEDTILSHPKVIDHFKCLYEVYQVGKRIQKSGTHCSNPKLDSIWNALSKYMSGISNFELELNPESSTDVPPGVERCEICLTTQTNLILLEANNTKYHPQCANLYLHCVDSILPSSTH